MEKSKKKYVVTIVEAEGSCNNDLFTKMAKNGDITAIKLKDLITDEGIEIKILGYAICKIETDEKNFTMNYIDSEEYGLISTGSEIFINSVIEYYEMTNNVRLKEVKTKKGQTFKAVPVLGKEKTKENEE